MCIKEKYYISVHPNGNMLIPPCSGFSEKYQVLLITAFVQQGLQNPSSEGALAISGCLARGQSIGRLVKLPEKSLCWQNACPYPIPLCPSMFLQLHNRVCNFESRGIQRPDIIYADLPRFID